MPLAMTRDEEADRHWAIVSNLTQLAEGRRPAGPEIDRPGARVRLGLALVRAGLALAPLRLEDVQGDIARRG